MDIKNLIINEIPLSSKLFIEHGLSYSTRRFWYLHTHNQDKYVENAKKILRPYVEKAYNPDNTLHKEMPKVVPVWVLWWQGYSAMPDLVKICFNSLRTNLPNGAKLILLTKDNYLDYVNIPNEIIMKVKKGYYSIALYSDLIRQQLLKNYGGFWIDSTIYCAHPISYDFLSDNRYWSTKLQPLLNYRGYAIGQKISDRKWGGFIQKAPKNHFINLTLYDALLSYMREHDALAEYFIQNLFISIMYESYPEVKDTIDTIPYSNPCLYDLKNLLNEKYDDEKWGKITENTTFFKLTWKQKFNKYDSNGNITFYGQLFES